jgi:hypothetical protein
MQLAMHSKPGAARNSSPNGVLARTLTSLEKNLGSAQAIRTNEKNMTFWASGLYAQGEVQPFLGNPASANHHYGLIAGCHYYHALTKQLFGMAIDVGMGDSIVNTNQQMRSDHRSAQITLYYNKTFAKNWKINVHGNFMKCLDRHQRPIDASGGRILAISNGVTHETSTSCELNYKHNITKDSYIKPLLGANYAHTKQFAYKEENAGNHNLSYSQSAMDQVGVQIGMKGSIGYQINEKQTFAVLPKLTYTNFVKWGYWSKKALR